MEEEAQIATTEMIIFKTPKHDMYKASKVPKKIHPIPRATGDGNQEHG